MAALSVYSFLMVPGYDSTSWPSSIRSSVTNALLPSVPRTPAIHLISLAFTFRQLVFDRFSFFITFVVWLFCQERAEKNNLITGPIMLSLVRLTSINFGIVIKYNYSISGISSSKFKSSFLTIKRLTFKRSPTTHIDSFLRWKPTKIPRASKSDAE